MAEFSFRVPKGMPEKNAQEIAVRVKAAYATYADTYPYPGSRHKPPLLVEAFPSDAPYTEHGKVKSVLWVPGMDHLNEWWLSAAHTLLQALGNEFPEQGVVVRHDGQGSALKLQPKRNSSAA